MVAELYQVLKTIHVRREEHAFAISRMLTIEITWSPLARIETLTWETTRSRIRRFGIFFPFCLHPRIDVGKHSFASKRVCDMFSSCLHPGINVGNGSFAYATSEKKNNSGVRVCGVGLRSNAQLRSPINPWKRCPTLTNTCLALYSLILQRRDLL